MYIHIYIYMCTYIYIYIYIYIACTASLRSATVQLFFARILQSSPCCYYYHY